MKHYLHLLILPLLFSSCNLTKMVQESTCAIQRNQAAVEASTLTIEENGQAVALSTALINQNAEAVRKSTQVIDQMNSFTEGLHFEPSMLIPIGILLLLLLLLPSLIALTIVRRS